jgi:hypothetical protein
MIRFSHCGVLSLVVSLVGCSSAGSPITNPAAPSANSTDTGTGVGSPWGPETPNFNLEVVLRGENGFGLVKFRQPNDSSFIVYLDVWIRELMPNTAYRLQRAVDTTLDGTCTSTDWLTLGQGSASQAIVTEADGTGRASLWRAVPPLPGSRFDIHFRVIEEASGAPVLQSGCHEYTVSL